MSCTHDERERERSAETALVARAKEKRVSDASRGLADDDEQKENSLRPRPPLSPLFSLSTTNSYNLKRKVAGLPPVTREWYDARAAALKASLTGAGGGAGGATSSSSRSALVGARTWLDPLTRKKFTSEATYRTFVSSNKYRELVKKSGLPAPEALVVVHSLESKSGGGGNGNGNEGGGNGGAMTRSQAAKKRQQATTTNVLPAMATPTTSDGATAASFRVAAPNGVTFAAGNDTAVEEEEASAGGDGSSGWETASDDDDDEKSVEPWDPTVSFFDNRKFETVEACLEHMWKKFSFYIPDVQHCSDPGGLLGYLGAKLRSGLIPLYYRGDDETSKRFHSLHAVQRHMIDVGICRVCWEGNEDEYSEWYQWSDDDDDEGDDDMDYSDDDDDETAAAANNKASATEEAFELALPNGKVIGARAFAKFYKQSHRPLARAAAAGTRAPQQQWQRVLSGAGAAVRAANLGSGLPGAPGALALTASGREQQRSAIVARYRAMGVKEADVPAAAKKERKARNAQQRGRARETLRSALAANINRNLPKNVPY